VFRAFRTRTISFWRRVAGTVTVLGMRFLAALILLLAACAPAPPVVVGWQDPDAHLVDGRWIGAETPCPAGKDGLECRTVLDQALANLTPEVRANATGAVLVSLPTTVVMASGETRTARLRAGIDWRRAVVVSFPDGTRRVVGLWCYLPYTADRRFAVEVAGCTLDPLDDWRDGNAPASYPPGTIFG
jgi:hypothetical protein